MQDSPDCALRLTQLSDQLVASVRMIERTYGSGERCFGVATTCSVVGSGIANHIRVLPSGPWARSSRQNISALLEANATANSHEQGQRSSRGQRDGRGLGTGTNVGMEVPVPSRKEAVPGVYVSSGVWMDQHNRLRARRQKGYGPCRMGR